MGVHGVVAAGARAARVDPLLADRVVEALLLVGLPVAHGGHGPGVHLFATGGAAGDGVDPGRWPLTLRWLCSARLEDAAAAAGAGSPWLRTRQVVAASVETALAELLPALGLAAVRETPDGPTRVGPADPADPADPARQTVTAAAAPAPHLPAETLPAETLAAVRRSAALAGLPLARHPRAAGVALTTCPPAPDAPLTTDVPDVVDVVDVAWRPSPRLPGAPAVSAAVREAMHHAVGSALTACGLRTSWHRPPDSPPHLHAVTPVTPAPAAATR